MSTGNLLLCKLQTNKPRSLRSCLLSCMGIGAVCVALFVLIHFSKERFSWLTAEQFTRAMNRNGFGEYKQLLLKRIPILAKRYRPNQLKESVGVFSSDSERDLKFMSLHAVGTNSTGCRAWILSSKEFAKYLRGIDFIPSSSTERPSQEGSEMKIQLPGAVEMEGETIQINPEFDIKARHGKRGYMILMRVHSLPVSTQLSSVSRTGTAHAHEISFDYACRGSVPDEGALIMEGQPADPSRKNYFFFMFSARRP